jgi:hypothetical protein
MKELTKKILELISNYSRVVGYKVDIKNSTVSYITNNKQVELEKKSQNTI